MPVQCVVLTGVAYKPKYANNMFAFKETVTEMWQHYEKEKSEAKGKKQQQSVQDAKEECHHQALAAAQALMFASKTSNIQVVMLEGAVTVDPAKYRAIVPQYDIHKVRPQLR